MIYLVTAYRFGFTKDTYPVYVGSDRKTAESNAEREAEMRGNKYGMGVFECVSGPDEMEFRPVRYIPSSMGESGPREDRVADMREQLGCFAYSAATERCIYEPAANATVMVKVPVEPPDWLLRKVAQLKEGLDYFESLP